MLLCPHVAEILDGRCKSSLTTRGFCTHPPRKAREQGAMILSSKKRSVFPGYQHLHLSPFEAWIFRGSNVLPLLETLSHHVLERLFPFFCIFGVWKPAVRDSLQCNECNHLTWQVKAQRLKLTCID